jgi:signal transduction histidine kinase
MIMKKILSILTLEVFGKTVPYDELVLQQRFRLFKITSLFAVLVFGIIIYQVSDLVPAHPLLLAFLILLFTLIIVNYLLLAVHKKTRISFSFLVILMFTMLHVLSYGQGGIRNSGIFYLAAIILTAYILLGKSAGKSMSIICVVHVIYFYFISRYTGWIDYSLIGKNADLIDLDFLISGTLSILVLTAQANYIERSKNAVIDDINAKKNELALINEELLHSQKALNLKNKEYEEKNKELEQFVYIASHDLHEPLRTTSGFVELLQKQYKGKLDEKADGYLSYIMQGTQRMKTLINDLLDYSRIGNNKELEQVDCNTVLQEVLSDLGTVLEETSARITWEPLPVIDGHPTAIKQLFQNLVTNGIKFRQGDIIPYIRVTAETAGEYWRFSFTDNGIGIDKQHRDKIFVIFQRLHTRKEYEGTGIGLAHCKKIVELHKGNIWVDSMPGEGSTFRFTILKNNN